MSLLKARPCSRRYSTRCWQPELHRRPSLHASTERWRLVRADPVCRQLMSVPGVGAIVAVTFKSGIDDPSRFRRSRDVGPHFGLTPRKYQSGEFDVTGSISKVGDRMMRTALYEAASVMLTRTVRMSPLKSWAMGVAKRRGGKKARVALARKLGVILHRMWVDGTGFRWTSERDAMA